MRMQTTEKMTKHDCLYDVLNSETYADSRLIRIKGADTIMLRNKLKTGNYLQSELLSFATQMENDTKNATQKQE